MPTTFLKEDNVQILPVKDGGRDTIYWDSSTQGLGLRVYNTGNRVYVIRYTTGSGHISHKTLGSADRLTLQAARSATQYRKRKAAEKLGNIYTGPKRTHQSRVEREIQCAYTKEGVHTFKTKNKYAKYCCTGHYHLNYNRTVPDNYKATNISPAKDSIPDVIYLPDETQERTSDLALLQHQLDQMERRIDQLVEEKLEEKLQQMAETLVCNLFALFTKGDK